MKLKRHSFRVPFLFIFTFHVLESFYFQMFLMKRFLLIFFGIVLFQGCSAQSSSRLVDASLETVTTEEYQYYLYFPESYDIKKDEKFPLLLFLHGGGESGGDLEEIKTNGPPKLITEGKQFPFLIYEQAHYFYSLTAQKPLLKE